MAAPEATVSFAAPSLLARMFGLGSVFGKSLRDSRRTAVITGLALGLIGFASGSQLALEFDTPADRAALAGQMSLLPAVFRGMLGDPIGIETLGGFLSWRVFNFLPVILGIWSLVALSGTLAGELARGSLELIAAGPTARRRLAIEKAAAHLVALAIAVSLFSVLTWAVGQAFAVLPGDEIPIGTAFAHGVWIFLASVVSGTAAFAVAPIVGRGAALGVGGAVLLGSFVINGYSEVVPVFESLRGLSFFAVTAGHRPIAGAWDWPSIGLLGAIVTGLLAVGVMAFERRDLLVPGGGGGRLRRWAPSFGLGIRGVFGRSFGERLPAALVWGVGLALYGALIASSADELVAALQQIPQFIAVVENMFPGADVLSTGGFMQLAFFGEAILFASIAAATFAAGWSSEEGERRLEVVLGAPVSRATWMVRSGLGVLAALGVVIAFQAVGVAVGATTAGDDIARPAIGSLFLGVYAAALLGVGFAVAGLVRSSLAAPVTLGLAFGFYLLDLIGSILRLPEWILDLSLNRHLGRPMLGDFDLPGLALCAILAIGGLAVGAWGLARRDIGR